MFNYYNDDDDDFGFYGDPRRCSVHGCITSSPNGLVDAPCPRCEEENHDDYSPCNDDDAPVDDEIEF